MSVLISDDMRGAVGRVVDWRVSYRVAASDVRRWAVAIHYPDPAPRQFLGEDPRVPEEFNPFAWAVAERMVPVIAPALRDTDTTEKALGVVGPGLRHQVNGGSDVTYGVPIRVGDVIRSETILQEYREKSGRMGPMLITVLESRWTNQHDDLVQLGHQVSIRY